MGIAIPILEKKIEEGGQPLLAAISKQTVYQMVPPYEGNEFVFISATTLNFGMGGKRESETYIFPCDKYGEVKEFLEINGSKKNTLSHEEVLRDIGYKIEAVSVKYIKSLED
jgi:hypothetical protein